MKRAATAISILAARFAAAVGLEGTFLVTGTVLLSIASTYVSPAGPLVVVGAMCILAGLALALPQRR